MKKILYSGFLLILLLTTNQVYAQQENLEELFEQMAEDFSESELDFDVLLDPIEEYLDQPLELNNATRSDLEKFFFLSESQIDSLFYYKSKYGNLASVYELQYIPGFDEATIYYLLPFIQIRYPSVYMPPTLERSLKYGRNTIITRSQWINEHQKGYWQVNDSTDQTDAQAYLGSKLKTYLRYSFKTKPGLEAGITAEKDAGEAFGGKYAPLGFDYYSMHFFYKGKSNLKSLAIGDYEVKFGQGLAMWTGTDMGKGSATTKTIKRAPTLKKYGSTNENRFLRGMAATYSFHEIKTTAFLSYNLVDASLETDSVADSQSEIKSLPEDGFHNTISSFNKKNKLGLFTAGTNVSYKTDKYKIGTSAIFNSFEHEILRSNTVYKKFDLQGKTNLNGSIDYETVLYHHINLAGEFAISQSGGVATLHTAAFQLAAPLKLSILYRYFTPNYQALYTAPFSESGEASNERGFYAGFEFIPIKNWILNGYADLYSFPWSRFRTTGPAQGAELYLKLYYRINRNSNTYIHIRHGQKPENLADQGDNIISSPVDVTKTNIRLQFVSKINAFITLKNRIEYTIYRKEMVKPEYGFLMYQDIALNLPEYKSVLNARFAIFDAAFNARLYAYESDVLYAFGFPAYFNRGTRWYLTYKYTISEQVDAWLRVSQWYYNQTESLSSGPAEIVGQTRTELKVQLRIKF